MTDLDPQRLIDASRLAEQALEALSPDITPDAQSYLRLALRVLHHEMVEEMARLRERRESDGQ